MNSLPIEESHSSSSVSVFSEEIQNILSYSKESEIKIDMINESPHFRQEVDSDSEEVSEYPQVTIQLTDESIDE